MLQMVLGMRGVTEKKKRMSSSVLMSKVFPVFRL